MGFRGQKFDRRWVRTKIARIFTVNGSCGSSEAAKSKFSTESRRGFSNGRLVDQTYSRDTPRGFKSVEITFEYSMMVFIDVTTFGVAVGVTVLSVQVELQNRY